MFGLYLLWRPCCVLNTVCGSDFSFCSSTPPPTKQMAGNREIVLHVTGLPADMTKRELFWAFGTFPGHINGELSSNGTDASVMFESREFAEVAKAATDRMEFRVDGAPKTTIRVDLGNQKSRNIRSDGKIITPPTPTEAVTPLSGSPLTLQNPVLYPTSVIAAPPPLPQTQNVGQLTGTLPTPTPTTVPATPPSVVVGGVPPQFTAPSYQQTIGVPALPQQPLIYNIPQQNQTQLQQQQPQQPRQAVDPSTPLAAPIITSGNVAAAAIGAPAQQVNNANRFYTTHMPYAAVDMSQPQTQQPTPQLTPQQPQQQQQLFVQPQLPAAPAAQERSGNENSQTLYVSRIPAGVTEAQTNALFSGVQVTKIKRSGSKAWLFFASKEIADIAMVQLNNYSFIPNEQQLKVVYARNEMRGS